jgi:hypothetical protein
MLFIIFLIILSLTVYIVKINDASFVEKIGKRINVTLLFGNYFNEFKDNSRLA